jgi:hypothetical protein
MNQSKINYYVTVFLSGAKRSMQGGRPSRYIEKKSFKDIRYYAIQFKAEDFNEVQKPFWKQYKEEYHKGYRRKIAIAPSLILKYVKGK